MRITKHDTKTQNEQMMLGKDTDRLAQCRVATNLLFIKNTIATKCNKASAIRCTFLVREKDNITQLFIYW